jgi:hypothetical protein
VKKKANERQLPKTNEKDENEAEVEWDNNAERESIFNKNELKTHHPANPQ